MLLLMGMSDLDAVHALLKYHVQQSFCILLLGSSCVLSWALNTGWTHIKLPGLVAEQFDRLAG